MRSLLFGACLALSGAAGANIAYLESGIGVSFDGCDFDKLINLRNGYVWQCSHFRYTYHCGKMTVLSVNGTTLLCVGNVERAIRGVSGRKMLQGNALPVLNPVLKETRS